MLRPALCLLLLTGLATLRADDAQLWTVANLRFVDRESWWAWLYAESRISDADPTVPTSIVAPRVQYRLHPLFSLGGGFARGQTTLPASGRDPRGFWRSEVEQQARLDLGDSFQLRLRNRWEHAWRDDGEETDRTRHRLELYARAPADWRPLHGVFVMNEFFHVWTTGRWQENRVVPVGLEWRLGEKSRLRTAWQWQLLNPTAGRQVSQALVLQLDMPLR